jgi:hypothetical protein
MKFFIYILLFSISFKLIAQDSESQKFPFNKMKLNFAVPDMPAFKAMGTEASNLLRPSSPQALSIIAPQFWSSDLNKTILPKNIALEISPILLSQHNKKVPISLNKYLNNKIINSFRISLGTSRDSTKKQPNATKLGVGFRITLVDKGDFNTSLKGLYDEATILAEWAEEELKNPNADKSIFFNKKLQDLKEKYKEENWNASKLDVAFAFVGRSSDQFTSNLKPDKVSFWITSAEKCKDWGQWLNGINYSYASNIYSEKDKKTINFPQFSYSSRLFIGSNDLKGFIEGQYMYNGFDKSNNGFANIGGEFTLGNSGIWIHCYAGYQHGDNLKQVIGNLDFRFSLPEK